MQTRNSIRRSGGRPDALDHAVLTSIAQRTVSTFKRSGERQDSVQCARRGARGFASVIHC
jgi:hypothetical protein